MTEIVVVVSLIAIGAGSLFTMLGDRAALAASTQHFSQIVNRPRQRGESLSAWNRRVFAALDELEVASREFLDAARVEGTCEQISPRGTRWHLPPHHPAAIRYARAKGIEIAGPDSPYRD